MDAPERDPETAPGPGWDDSLHFAPRASASDRERMHRVLAGAFVFGLHLLIVWGIETLSAPHELDEVEATQAIAVDFIETLPAQVIHATRDPEPVHAPATRAVATQ